MPGNVGIGVLVADSPYGSFKDPIGKPLIKNSDHDIDPTVMIDDDGQAYMYWGNPKVYYVKLNKDMISFSGEIMQDPTTPANYQEGPWVWKREGMYYMAYASDRKSTRLNSSHVRISYAVFCLKKKIK